VLAPLRASRQLPILPGKLAVRGLPGAERRDAEAAGRSALDWELSRRQDALAREDRPVSCCRRGHPGCVTAGTARGRVRGWPRGGSGPRRCAAALEAAGQAAAFQRRVPLPSPPRRRASRLVARFPLRWSSVCAQGSSRLAARRARRACPWRR